MSYLEDTKIIGKISDPINNEFSQEMINSISLYEVNKNNLLDSIKYRISRFELSYLLDELKDSLVEKEYWLDVLKEIINVYKFNSLKIFLSNDRLIDKDISIEIMNLVKFIKINLIEMFEDKEIQLVDNMGVMYKKLKEKENVSKLFLRGLLFVDIDSYDQMVKILDNESKQDYKEL